MMATRLRGCDARLGRSKASPDVIDVKGNSRMIKERT